MALFVATLATLIITGLFWNQFVVLRTIENQQLTVQSRLLLTGALDWARAILREDAGRSTFDALTEPWAQPLAETRLDQLGETSTLASKATIAGQMEDVQARLNLRNLVGQDGLPIEKEVDALRRLCESLSLPSATADLIAMAVLQSLPAQRSQTEGGTPSGADSGSRALPIVLPQDLLAVPGLDRQAAEKLAPYVFMLDRPTKVNVNTASAEVLAARIDKLSLAAARALVAERERLGYFNSVGDFRNRLRTLDGNLDDRQLDVQSGYFLVRGQVKLDRAVTRLEALVQRLPNQPVQVLWRREL